MDNVESPEHLSCINKHILSTIEQASEGISHSTSVATDKVEYFTKIMYDSQDLLDGLEYSIPSKTELIQKVREIRAVAEQLRPGFQLSECKLCSFERHGETKNPSPPMKLSAKEVAKLLPTKKEREGKGEAEGKFKIPPSTAVVVLSAVLMLAGMVFRARE